MPKIKRILKQLTDQVWVCQMDIVAAVSRPGKFSAGSAGEIGPHDLLPQCFDLSGLLLGSAAELPDLPAGNIGIVGHQGNRDRELLRFVQQPRQLLHIVSAIVFRQGGPIGLRSSLENPS